LDMGQHNGWFYGGLVECRGWLRPARCQHYFHAKWRQWPLRPDGGERQ
jgi:hypothetical protein